LESNQIGQGDNDGHPAALLGVALGRPLSGCRRGACPARYQRGDTVTIAYDPQQVDSVDLASRVVGRHPLLDRWVLALVLMGVGFLVAAAVNLQRNI
jgi:hypothetical protein